MQTATGGDARSNLNTSARNSYSSANAQSTLGASTANGSENDPLGRRLGPGNRSHPDRRARANRPHHPSGEALKPRAPLIFSTCSALHLSGLWPVYSRSGSPRIWPSRYSCTPARCTAGKQRNRRWTAPITPRTPTTRITAVVTASRSSARALETAVPEEWSSGSRRLHPSFLRRRSRRRRRLSDTARPQSSLHNSFSRSPTGRQASPLAHS